MTTIATTKATLKDIKKCRTLHQLTSYYKITTTTKSHHKQVTLLTGMLTRPDLAKLQLYHQLAVHPVVVADPTEKIIFSKPSNNKDR